MDWDTWLDEPRELEWEEYPPQKDEEDEYQGATGWQRGTWVDGTWIRWDEMEEEE
jgi:hypothetical protein